MQTDDATTGGLTEAIETLLPALEHFLQWTSPERTASERAVWSAQLDEPLPQTGAGPETVLTLLRDVVIPNGVRLGAPGFSGWVATMPTTLPAAANFAAVIAGSAYQCIRLSICSRPRLYTGWQNSSASHRRIKACLPAAGRWQTWWAWALPVNTLPSAWE